jgi:hypothetical protein
MAAMHQRWGVRYLFCRLMAALLFGLPILAAPPVAAQTVRKSIDQLTDQELMSFRRGVAVMMARNSAPRKSGDFRRSWVYWANMHAHFGASCRGPKIGSNMSTVKLWSANNPNEVATWCKCEHGTLAFLTWHRMYLYYFERVLQEASNDPDLRLPYWDYNTAPLLPAAYRASTYVDEYGAALANPLRVSARRAALNNGTAALASATVSTANAMAATDYATFSARLEQGPHGPVHCSIATGGCPNGLMGSVPASALDPIFYAHHTNIDRLYECWLQVDPAGRLPEDPEELNRQYAFVDANGLVVTRTVSDMLRTDQLGYAYGTGGGCPAVAVPAASLVAQSGSTPLGAEPMTVPLSVETTAPTGGAPARQPGPPPTVTVIMEGVTAKQVPGILYNVYLATGAGQRALIGVIDFFGFDATGSDGGHHSHGDTRAGRRFELDATAAFRPARASGQCKAATGLRADDRPHRFDARRGGEGRAGRCRRPLPASADQGRGALRACPRGGCLQARLSLQTKRLT